MRCWSISWSGAIRAISYKGGHRVLAEVGVHIGDLGAHLRCKGEEPTEAGPGIVDGRGGVGVIDRVGETFDHCGGVRVLREPLEHLEPFDAHGHEHDRSILVGGGAHHAHDAALAEVCASARLGDAALDEDDAELPRSLDQVLVHGQVAALDKNLRCTLHPHWPTSCERFPYSLSAVRREVVWGTRCGVQRREPTAARSDELFHAAVAAYNERIKDAVLLTHARSALDALGLGTWLCEPDEDPFEPAVDERLPVVD